MPINSLVPGVFKRNGYPSGWLVQVDHFYLLQVIEMGSRSDRDSIKTDRSNDKFQFFSARCYKEIY